MIAAILDAGCVWQPDMDRAAVTALASVPNSNDEYAGAIYRDAQGRYCYSTPVRGADDTFSFRVVLPTGTVLAGLYHTHLGDDGLAPLFSAGDVRQADRLGAASYILVRSRGIVLRYVPGRTGTMPIHRNGSLRTLTVSRGENLGVSL